MTVEEFKDSCCFSYVYRCGCFMDPNASTTRTVLTVLEHDELLSGEFVFYFQTVSTVFIVGFSLFGCFSNVVNMIVFPRQGFKDSINISLFAIAVSDFGSCFTMLLGNTGGYSKLNELDHLPFYPDQVVYVLTAWPHLIFTKITTILTALIVFERCVCVVMPIKIKTTITPKRIKIFVILTFVIVAASVIPGMYANRMGWKYDTLRNRSILGIVFTDNRNEIDRALLFSHSVVFSIFSFLAISICTYILHVNLKRKAVWRKSATSTTVQTDDNTSRDMKVAKMVVLVSALFIVCFIPYTMLAVAMASDEELSITGTRARLCWIFYFIATVPKSINASSNIFIYYTNSSRYKTTFKTIFGSKTKSDQ